MAPIYSGTSMRTSRSATTGGQRRLFYMLGGILLTAALCGYWFKDDLAALVRADPPAEAIIGSWVFDAPRAQEMLMQIYGNQEQFPALAMAYSTLVYTITPDSLSIDSGNESVQAMACTIVSYPPNAYRVIVGEESPPREFLFERVLDDAGEHLHLSADGSTIPLKRQ